MSDNGSTRHDLGRRDFLILKLALKKGWLEPQALRAALQATAAPLVDQLVAEQFLSPAQLDKLAGAVAPQVARPEPEGVFKRKDRLFRHLLVEGQECPLGAISSALSDQKRGNGGVPIGEILLGKGMLSEDRLAALRREVDDRFYRRQAALLCGSQDEAEPELPQLSDFEVLEEIGRGGMGIIYKARQKGLDRIVALKVLDPEHGHQTKILRFQREAKALSQLRHPNIVSILQVGEEQGWHFFAMELIEGRTLEQVLDHEDLSLAARLRLVAQVSSGVAHAHAKGILHRDIKPANIVLDAKGVPKLTDFGLARNLREDTLLTRDGAILGTPFYMAPEQIKGQRDQIGPHTDQFALGVLLYEAIAGELPFHGSSSVEIYHKILHDDPVPLERMAPDAPEGLGLVQRKALAKAPAERYESVARLAEDLEALLDGRPISLRPPGFVWRGWCRLRCHQAGLAAALLLLLGLLTAGIWWRNLRGGAERSAPAEPVAPRPQPPAPRPAQRTERALLAEKLEALETRIEHALAARRYAEVHELATAMRKLDPGGAASYLHEARGWWLTRQQDKLGHARRVIDATTHALQREPKLVAAYSLQGQAYRSAARHRKAYQSFSAGLRIDPGDRECLQWRAFTLLALNRPAEALADLNLLLERFPEDLNIRYYRGQVHILLGMTSKAIEDLGRFLRKRPEIAQAWFHRAQCYEKEEKLELARNDYRRSLEAGLPPQDALVARARLAAVERRLR